MIRSEGDRPAQTACDTRARTEPGDRPSMDELDRRTRYLAKAASLGQMVSEDDERMVRER
jgi:hypothetical protein